MTTQNQNLLGVEQTLSESQSQTESEIEDQPDTPVCESDPAPLLNERVVCHNDPKLGPIRFRVREIARIDTR